jgi:hypothetical protein
VTFDIRGIPRPTWTKASKCGTLLLALLQKKLTHFIISIAVLENVPPNAGLHKRATFSTLNVGLAGTGNQTRATCVASSVASRSAIHYASVAQTRTAFFTMCIVKLLEKMISANAKKGGFHLFFFASGGLFAKPCTCTGNGLVVPSSSHK